MHNCPTSCPPRPAPNQDPKRWQIIGYREFEHAYVLIVRYFDAINFEGIKVMVYQGQMPDLEKIDRLDPHFETSGLTPIARFRPTKEGRALAYKLAGML